MKNITIYWKPPIYIQDAIWEPGLHYQIQSLEKHYGVGIYCYK